MNAAPGDGGQAHEVLAIEVALLGAWMTGFERPPTRSRSSKSSRSRISPSELAGSVRAASGGDEVPRAAHPEVTADKAYGTTNRSITLRTTLMTPIRLLRRDVT